MLQIYKASAGSGKTYRLAAEYIKMLLGVKGEDGRYRLNRNPGRAHRSILAVTFTNKATGEMKRRILHELALLGGCEPGWEGVKCSYEEDLVKEMRCSPEALRSAARRALVSLTMDYGFFNISTIDSFFQVVLRAFAREARVLGDYSVSLDDEDIITRAVRELLSELNHADAKSAEEEEANTFLQDWIARYLRTQLREGSGFNIFNQTGAVQKNLVNFIKNISDERFTLSCDSLMEWLSRSDRPMEKLRESLEDARCLTLEMMTENARSAQETVNSHPAAGRLTKYAAEFFGKLAQNPENATSYTGKTFEKIINGDEAAFKKNGFNEDLSRTLSNFAEEAWRLYNNLTAFSAAYSSLFLMGLVGRVYGVIDRLHREENTIQLSDTNALLRTILGEDDAPFVYERLGMHLAHFLIDEFQDTSLLQWQNLRPLIAESHSYDSDNLIIGDEKQCIYRFRNSDPTLLKSQVQREFDRVRITGSDISENTNWRSSETIVRFNNTFFARAPLSPANRDIYSNVVQQVSPGHKDHHGYVCIRFLPKEKDEDTQAADFGDLLPDGNDAALQLLCSDICRQLAAGYAPSDIAVLTRRRNEATAVITTLLKLSASGNAPADFTVISDDALLVSSSPVVRSVITRLRFLGAADVAARARVMTPRRFAALFNTYEQALADMEEREAGDALTAAVELLEERDSSLFPENPGTEVDSLLATDLSVIVERVLASMPSAERDAQAIYVTALMDLVTQYIDAGQNDINSFLRWWDDCGSQAKVSSPENPRAIRVMTIHKSKGLEFKCVHIPFGAWPMKKLKGHKWFDPSALPGMDPSILPPIIPLSPAAALQHTCFGEEYQRYVDELELDEINTLYVALTRAVDELSLTVREPRAVSEASTWAMIRNTVESMLHEEPDDLHAPLIKDPLEETYFAGAPITRVSAKTKEKPGTALDTDTSAPMPPYGILDRSDLWRDTSLDRDTDFDELSIFAMRSRGSLLHAALEHVRTESDVPRAVHRLVNDGRLPRQHAATIEALLKREVSRPEAHRWFHDVRKLMSERPIFTGVDADGNFATRRPDRVVWTADGHIDIIDYKSGDDECATEAKLLERYGSQLRRYRRLLAAALPPADRSLPIRTYIWHLDHSLITEVI